MKKTRIFKVIALTVIITVLASSFSINLSGFNENDDNSDICYLTNGAKIKDYVETNAEEVHSKVKLNVINKIQNNTNNKVIWIDGEMMGNSNNKETLIKLFNKGCKIVIRKDSLTELEVLKYFNLSSYGLFLSDINNSDNLKRIGVSIQKYDDGSFDIVVLNSEQYYTEAQIQDGLLFATKNKFTDRLREKNKKKGLFVLNTAHAEWTQVNLASGIDYRTLVDVSWAMIMSKETNNPIAGTKYYNCRKTQIEAIPHSSASNPAVAINGIYLWTDGDNYYKKSGALYPCKILDYTPMNSGTTDASGSLTLQFPWGVGFSFNVGGMQTSYKTDSGGMGTSAVQVSFIPSTMVKDKRFSGCVTTEMYQDSTMNTKPTYYRSNMTYTVATQNYIARPNSYYSERGSHYITGNQ